mgnify:FL=1
MRHQQIKAEVTIKIPSEYVIISKEEYKSLKEQDLLGRWWRMKDLEQRLNKKHEWIKENILYSPRFRKILDAKNGGPVYYPDRQGRQWSFNALRMAEFLTKNFGEIYRDY